MIESSEKIFSLDDLLFYSRRSDFFDISKKRKIYKHNFSNADFSKNLLANLKFKNCSFKSANFSYSVIKNVDICNDVCLDGANFSRAFLKGVVFFGTDLRDANFGGKFPYYEIDATSAAFNDVYYKIDEIKYKKNYRLKMSESFFLNYIHASTDEVVKEFAETVFSIGEENVSENILDWIKKLYPKKRLIFSRAMQKQEDDRHTDKNFVKKFKAIYNALYDGQSGLKSRRKNLEGIITGENIEAFVKERNDSSRRKLAYDLTIEYFDKKLYDGRDIRLKKEIYKHAFKRSHCGFFARSKVFGKTLYTNDAVESEIRAVSELKNSGENTRSWKIHNALGG